MRKIEKKLRHLRKFGFKKNELSQIRRMYEGKFFDEKDPAYLRLLAVSENLCKEYSSLIAQEMLERHKNKDLKISALKYLKFYFKKLKILKNLFPIHGFILYAEDGIEAVVGLVDLKGYGFINRNVKFTPHSLVDVCKSNIFAFNIQVGDEDFERKDGYVKLSSIKIEKSCWICAGVKIFGNVKIEEEAVVGAGAYVNNNVKKKTLVVGRPSKQIREIDKHCKLGQSKYSFSETEKQQIKLHVEAHNNGKFPKSFKNIIEGNPFNTMDKSLGFLYRLTKWLCFELNSKNTSPSRRQEILDILFVGHAKNLTVGQNLQVDMLGTIFVGDNVKIGNNVTLGGNLVIEENVEIGDNSILFASGHSLIANERKMRFSLKKGFYEDTQYTFIKVAKNIKIGKNVVIVPDCEVNQNVKDNALFVKGKIL